MSKWKEVVLSKVATIIADGLHGTPQFDDKGEYFFINGNNLNQGRILIKSDTKRVNEEEAKKYERPLSDKTILLSINGTIGNLALYNNEKCILGKSACYINVNEENDRKFLYYIFLNKDFQSFIVENATGTTIPNVPLKGLREYTFNIPPLPEQQSIASVLSSLDDIIDLLHRQNVTLEKMAETLFRQLIEEKRNDDTISHLVNIQNGYAFKSKDFRENGVQGVIKIKNISGGIIDIVKTDFVENEIVESLQERFRIKTGDILIAMTGAEIGKLGIIPKTNKNLWLNQRVGLLKEKYKGSKYLAYLQLKTEFGQDYIENTATGSAQPNISGTGIENCGFPKLSDEDIKDYSFQIGELYEKVILNLGQIRTLSTLRDTLLPKFLNGEVTVIE